MSKETSQQRDRARHAWAIMNENEKNAIRIGVIPHWAMLEDFGGKAGRSDARWPELTTSEEHRLFSVALFECGRSAGKF